jgi:structural maintenance of chromosome 2
LLLELDSFKAEVHAAEEAVVAAEKALQEANTEEDKLQIKVGEMKSNYDIAKATLDEVEEKMATYSSELKALSKEKATLTKHEETAELEAKKMSIKVAKFHKERGSAKRLVSNMIKKYSWIETEKDAFGVLGGDYDFEATDPLEMSRQLKELKDEQSSLVRFLFICTQFFVDRLFISQTFPFLPCTV